MSSRLDSDAGEILLRHFSNFLFEDSLEMKRGREQVIGKVLKLQVLENVVQ
jgi:hypothetical protein